MAVAHASYQRNGADYSVYVNTAQEFDGSDSGARPDEAVSWGKIKVTAKPTKVICIYTVEKVGDGGVQVYGEASVIFPLLVAETFARQHHEKKKTLK